MFIIIPIDKKWSSANNAGSKSVNCLLVAEKENGAIKYGNIVQYTPANGSVEHTIPGNMFSKINKAGIIEDSRITYFTSTNKFISELEFKNGKMYKFRVLEDKYPQRKRTRQKTPDCIDWDLVTYEQGALILETYMYTTCDPYMEAENMIRARHGK
jgi:hypothetical protein